MSFSRMINRGKANVTKFFNSTLPNATRSGVRFLNNTVIPAAKKAHNVTKAIPSEVETNEAVPKRMKERVKKASDFSDLGLSKLETVQGSVNRISKNLGLD